MRRRLAIFETTPLPPSMQVDSAIDIFHSNPMEYIHWMANHINEHRHLLPEKELFYESMPNPSDNTLDLAKSHLVDRLRNNPLEVVSGTAFENRLSAVVDVPHNVSDHVYHDGMI